MFHVEHQREVRVEKLKFSVLVIRQDAGMSFAPDVPLPEDL